MGPAGRRLSGRGFVSSAGPGRDHDCLRQPTTPSSVARGHAGRRDDGSHRRYFSWGAVMAGRAQARRGATGVRGRPDGERAGDGHVRHPHGTTGDLPQPRPGAAAQGVRRLTKESRRPRCGSHSSPGGRVSAAMHASADRPHRRGRCRQEPAIRAWPERGLANSANAARAPRSSLRSPIPNTATGTRSRSLRCRLNRLQGCHTSEPAVSIQAAR